MRCYANRLNCFQTNTSFQSDPGLRYLFFYANGVVDNFAWFWYVGPLKTSAVFRDSNVNWFIILNHKLFYRDKDDSCDFTVHDVATLRLQRVFLSHMTQIWNYLHDNVCQTHAILPLRRSYMPGATSQFQDKFDAIREKAKFAIWICWHRRGMYHRALGDKTWWVDSTTGE